MKTVFMWLFVLSCCVGVAAAQQAVRSYNTTVALDIDTHGHVINATLPGDLPSMLDAPAKAAVLHWYFKPVMKNGVAVTARTYANIKLEVFQQAPGKYGVRVNYLSNGPSVTFTQATKYPAEMVLSHTGGTLQMKAVVQPDGSITDIQVTDAKISGTPRRGPEHAKEVFGRAARVAMQHAQAKPEWIDGKPVATAISKRFEFNLDSSYGGAKSTGSAVGPALGTDN